MGINESTEIFSADDLSLVGEIAMSDDALAKFPLPDGVSDGLVNKGELAQAFRTSENTVDRWLRNPEFPVVEGGSNGRPYVFRLSHVWAWNKSREDAETRRRQEKNRAVHQMQMHFLGLDPADGEEGVSVGDRAAMAKAELIYMQVAQKRRELIKVVDAADLFEAVFSHIRDATSALPDRLGRECGLTPEQIERAAEVCDGILLEVSNQIASAELEQRDLDEVGGLGGLPV